MGRWEEVEGNSYFFLSQSASGTGCTSFVTPDTLDSPFVRLLTYAARSPSGTEGVSPSHCWGAFGSPFLETALTEKSYLVHGHAPFPGGPDPMTGDCGSRNVWPRPNLGRL